MFKFLRQYNKWILVVFGGLLMVVFLVPTTIQAISRQSAALGTTWAEIGGSKVAERDRLEAAGQLQTLEAFERGMGFPVLTQLRAMTGLDPRDPAHWYLLVREAQQGGFVGGADEGRAWLRDQLAATASTQTEAQVLGQLAGSSRQSPTEVLEALSNARGVVRMLQMAGGLPISDARAKRAASESQTAASADVVVIDATKPLAEGEPAAPSLEAMQKQFDSFRDKAPGSGERGFGYLVPNRVQIEWFRVPIESVRQSLDGDARLSELEVRKAYLKDPGFFFPPGVGGGFPNFDDVAEDVRTKVADSVARERIAEIERFVEDQLALGLRGIPRSGGYYEMTPERIAKQPTFADLATSVSEKFKIPVPEYTASGEWMVPADAAKIPRLGSATTTRFGPRARRVHELLEVTREFGGSPTMLIQKGVAGPPMTLLPLGGNVGDLIFFRVVDANPAHAPASIDEVADTVRNDLLRELRFAKLQSDIPAIEQMAVSEGLGAVAAKFGTSVQFMPRISEGAPVNIPGVGQDPEAVKAILARAMLLPKTTPVADVPDADRTFVVESPARLVILAVRLTSLRPLAAEDFEQLATTGLLRRQIGNRIPSVMLTDLYGMEPLSSRHQFKLARVSTEQEVEPKKQ